VKPTVTHLVLEFYAFMEPEGSLSCSKDSATGSHPEPVESSSHSHRVFLTNYSAPVNLKEGGTLISCGCDVGISCYASVIL
jgi:hypothetical protein